MDLSGIVGWVATCHHFVVELPFSPVEGHPAPEGRGIPQLPQMMDGLCMTLRLHEFVGKGSYNDSYTFVAAQAGLDEKTVRSDMIRH